MKNMEMNCSSLLSVLCFSIDVVVTYSHFNATSSATAETLRKISCISYFKYSILTHQYLPIFPKDKHLSLLLGNTKYMHIKGLTQFYDKTK